MPSQQLLHMHEPGRPMKTAAVSAKLKPKVNFASQCATLEIITAK